MRAIMRITCLLLLFSFLFHRVCSNVDGPAATSVTKNVASVTPRASAMPTDGSASGTEPAIDSKAGVTVGVTTGAHPTDDAGKKNEPTQASTPAKPTAAVTMPPVPTAATSKPTDKQTPTQPQAPTVTNTPAAPSTVISDAPTTVKNVATPFAAMPSQPKTPTPAATADSSSSSAAPLYAATLQTSAAPVPSKTSRTEAAIGNPANVGTTKITKVSTDTPAPDQQSMTHTPITTKPGQDNKGSTEEATVTITSHKHMASKAPEPTGNKGTTSSPSTPTKARPPASETSGTKTGPYPTSPQSTTSTTTTTTTTAAQPKMFLYSLNNGQEMLFYLQEEDEKDLVEVCRRLMVTLQDGNCTLMWRHHNGQIQFDRVELNGKVKTSLATQYYEEITKKPTDNKTLIAILASCGALLIMIVILAVCASHHRRPYNENQHLTEELHTVENGYHDNPTLEVMEVQPEMQEKKMVLNGEFNDSWIVPIDNLLKEDIPDEEDTHL
ncbi:podocalyxin isoform X1 [Epinephelus lanceolatus]|uniref:podocalyxin isoform X2 n=1 Tax=Epinephelus lanceolatus TaxID=310571 RepID=UPI0014474D7F|nr:podocalyxin isoform X2 [Epinephelus lanceolatus]